jgi:hypothetical protein
MRLYFIIQDQSAIRQTPAQRREQDLRWREQPFAAFVAARLTGPNEQLTAGKISPAGQFRLGGIDLLDDSLIQRLDAEASQIDARFKQVHRQLELVLLSELRAALPPDDLARADQLSVQVVAYGERDAAVAGVQAYLRASAAVWDAGLG